MGLWIAVFFLLVALTTAWSLYKATAWPIVHTQSNQMHTGDPIPAFNRAEFTSDMLRGHVSIVNFFSSWCAPCEAEHPQLMRLKNQYGFSLYGINYKDSVTGRVDFLQRLGNPYDAIIPDIDGEFSALWHVDSVPETLIIDPAGRIHARIRTPITPEMIEQTLLPMLREIQ